MDKKLLEEELVILKKYRLDNITGDSFRVADLLYEIYLKDFLEKLAPAIGAPSLKAAASIFMKRYAFLAVMSLYSMTAWNKKLNVHLNNLEMESANKGKTWLPAFSLKDPTFEDWDGLDRGEWRSRVFKELFAENLFPLISVMEKTVGISKLILWENIAVYLFWLYETELKDSKNANVTEDFRYLLFEAEGSLFGRYKLNPLQKYYAEKTYVSEWNEDIRIRKTCCFSYQLPEGKRCKVCPCTHLAKDGRCHDGESICSAVRSFA